MKHRYPSFPRALLLLLVALGPLQAQAVFACTMMESVMHDVCCCDEHNADELALESVHEPCCEQSVEVAVDQDIGHSTPIGNPAELRFDADPPEALGSSIDTLTPPQRTLTPGDQNFISAAARSGSDLYLVTQRLRI